MNVNDKALEILQDTMKGLVSSPGKGAERACAIIASLGSAGFPMGDITEFKISWVWMDDEIFPDIRIKAGGKSFNMKG